MAQMLRHFSAKHKFIHCSYVAEICAVYFLYALTQGHKSIGASEAVNTGIDLVCMLRLTTTDPQFKDRSTRDDSDPNQPPFLAILNYQT